MRVHLEELRFGDDGTFPNNTLPLLLYRQALDPATNDLASVLERRFAASDWTGSWRNSVFPFPHYHSTYPSITLESLPKLFQLKSARFSLEHLRNPSHRSTRRYRR